MYLKLDDKRVINSDYLITLGVSEVKDSGGHHVVGQMINGEKISLFMYDTKDAAKTKLEMLTKDHNLHHTEVHGKINCGSNRTDIC